MKYTTLPTNTWQAVGWSQGYYLSVMEVMIILTVTENFTEGLADWLPNKVKRAN
jgi:hypothetical protein